MEAKYKINKDKNLLIEKIQGNVTSRDLIELRKNQCAKNIYKSGILILSDLRESTLNLSYIDIKLIALFCKNNIGFLRNIRIAFVINTPHQAALCNIFKDLVENLPLTVEIFCTYERAYSFLDSYKHVASCVC